MLGVFTLQMPRKALVHKLCQLDIEFGQYHCGHQHQEDNLACMGSSAPVMDNLQGPLC